MQKLFDAHVDRFFLAGSAANEEFPPPAAPLDSPAEIPQAQDCGWNAFEIWHRRIRPGVRDRLQPQP
jgi:hypothetical protein